MSEQDLEILNQNTVLAKQSWYNFLSFHQVQKELLLERKSISAERIAELELLLKAGRSDISELAKEIFGGRANGNRVGSFEYFGPRVRTVLHERQIFGRYF